MMVLKHLIDLIIGMCRMYKNAFSKSTSSFNYFLELSSGM